MRLVKPKKFLGQHFLKDLKVAQNIADTVDACPGLPILEVGPGMGVLTQFLLPKERELKVVEVDYESVAYLREAYPQLEEVLQFLQQDIEDTAVIFVDNVNATEEEEPFLQELANAKCSVICTSRITEFSHYETVPIDFFSVDDCVKLFDKYYGVEFNDEKIRRIVTRAGRHTLVIEILAKIAKAERYTLTDLEKQLQERGFDLEGIASVELREDTLIGHLSHTFSTEKLNRQQEKILYCMSILPAERISYQFKEWLGLPNRYNLNYLESFQVLRFELKYL